MKKLINICLYSIGIEDFRLLKEVERYLYNEGYMYFKYDEYEDYGDLINDIYKYLKTRKIKY